MRRPERGRDVAREEVRDATREGVRTTAHDEDVTYDDARDDASSAGRAPLVERWEALAEAGEVDPRALADALGVAPGALEAHLADPAALDAGQQATVLRLLGVDRALLAAARGARRARALAADGAVPTRDGTTADGSPGGASEDAGHAVGDKTTDAVGDVTADLAGDVADGTARPPDASGRGTRLTETGASRTGARAAGTGLFAPPPRPAALATPPRSTLDALERALAAVRDDDVGHALRLGALDVVEGAARARGRPLPPAVHELRARLVRGALPWSAGAAWPEAWGGTNDGAGDGVGDGADDRAAPGDAPNARGDAIRSPAARDRARRAADAPLVDATATLVRILQHGASGWDDLFAPLHDDAIAALLPRHTLVVHAVPAPPTERAVLLPPLVGRHLLVLSEAASVDARRLAVRRALAHLAAGHLDEARPLPEPAPPAWQALADGAALADLLPFWQLADLRRRGRMGWSALEAWVAGAVRALAPAWEAGRVADAARRRVALWRAEGA